MCAIIIKRRRRFKSKRRDRDASDKTFVARTFQFHVVLVRCFHHAFPDGRVDGDFLPGLFHEDDANCLLLLLLRFRRVSAISSVWVVRRRRRERKARPRVKHVPRRRRHEIHPGSHNPFPKNAFISHVSVFLWFDDGSTKAAAQSRTSAQQAFMARRREHRDTAFPPVSSTNQQRAFVCVQSPFKNIEGGKERRPQILSKP